MVGLSGDYRVNQQSQAAENIQQLDCGDDGSAREFLIFGLNEIG
jgi:hypothetical protein